MHSLRDLGGAVWFAQNCACYCFLGNGSGPVDKVPYMLASVRQPSLHGYDACMVVWVKGACLRNCRQNIRKTSFSRFFFVFLCSRNSSFWWRGTLVWHLWIGRARHPGPGAAGFAVEVFHVGGWLTHGELVLDTEVDFFGCCGASVDPC